MGFTPRDIDTMSPWEFSACVAGWNKANGDGKPVPPTPEEFDEILSRSVH